MLNLAGCNAQSIRCPAHLAKFSSVLVKTIDMVPFGKPIIVRFGEDDKMGYTLVQLIETSNVMAHFCESTNDAYLDIFSCKHFHANDALHVVQGFFQPTNVSMTFLERSARSIPRIQSIELK